MTTAMPYKGLAPYEPGDRENFFGREQEKNILLGKILAHKLTLLYAATGVGKSSLLGAAVIPELEDVAHDNLDVAYHRTWTTDPIAAMQETVRQTLLRRKKLAAADLPDLQAPTLAAFLEQCSAYSSDPLILVLDQFEELFRYHAGEATLQPCIAQLAQVMTDSRLPVAVVIAMREDFLAELSVFRGQVPDLFSNHYRLQKLSPEQARQAIVKPVERDLLGFRYEPTVAEALLKDLAERERAQQELRGLEASPASLPFIEGPYLQLVCGALWEREQNNPEKTIRKATYDALGGARTITQQYFAKVMQRCNRAEQRLASRAFDFLVTEWGTKMAYPEQVLARILKVRPEKLRPVLQHLKDARVLRDDQRPEGIWYELYHDVFADIIGKWNRDFQGRRRRLLRFASASLAFLVAVAVSVVGYQWYQLRLLVERNVGTLRVENPAGARLTLTCVHHYGENQSCPEVSVPVSGASLEVPGPADYTLTAEKDSAWTLSYPVYVHGYGHTVPVTIQPPPASLPERMAFIPGGVFRMGDKDDRDGMGAGDEQPQHDATVDSFFIDQYEVTNEQYQQCVAEGKCPPTRYDDKTCYRLVQKEEKWEWEQGAVEQTFQEPHKPVVCVDWQQAQTYCESLDKRLPTEAEWEKAAAGPEGYKWAFGNEFDGTKLNYCDRNCAFSWQDKKSDDGSGWTATVGSYPANTYQLYDMSGNVWEWVMDWYDETFYSKPAATEKNAVNRIAGKDSLRVVRGGGWNANAEDSRVASRFRNRPENRNTNLGFRCVLPAQKP